jgi:hypothetical protein
MGILLGKGKVFGEIIDFYEKVGTILRNLL